MYNILIVNDSSVSERNIKELLQHIPRINVIGKVVDFDELIFHIHKEKIDILIVYINTNSDERLQNIQQIMDHDPNIKVVLVSNSKNFAIRAFEIGVYDYILEPIKKERIIKTFNRIFFDAYTDKVNSIKNMEDNIAILIQEKADTIHWRTKNTKNLFLYLIKHKEVAVKKDVLLEMFWPNTRKDKAVNSLYNSIFILRDIITKEFPGMEIKNVNDCYLLTINENVLMNKIIDLRRK